MQAFQFKHSVAELSFRQRCLPALSRNLRGVRIEQIRQVVFRFGEISVRQRDLPALACDFGGVGVDNLSQVVLGLAQIFLRGGELAAQQSIPRAAAF